jgi:hypothetical protein
MTLTTRTTLLSILALMTTNFYAMHNLTTFAKIEDTIMPTTACESFTIIDNYIPEHHRDSHLLAALAQVQPPLEEENDTLLSNDAAIEAALFIITGGNFPSDDCKATPHETTALRLTPVSRTTHLEDTVTSIAADTPAVSTPLAQACAAQEETPECKPIPTTLETPQSKSPMLPLTPVHAHDSPKEETKRANIGHTYTRNRTLKKIFRSSHFNHHYKQSPADQMMK